MNPEAQHSTATAVALILQNQESLAKQFETQAAQLSAAAKEIQNIKVDLASNLHNVPAVLADHENRIRQTEADSRDNPEQIKGILNRLSSLEKKVWWFSGAAAAVGGAIGSALQSVN